MGLSNLRTGLWIFRASFAIVIILMVPIPFMNAWGDGPPPNPTFTLVGPVLKLEPGAKEGQATMLLKADGLDKTAKENPRPPEILDQKIPSPPSVNVIFSAKEMQVTDSSRSWLLSADIKELPANSSQKRFLMKFAGFERTLDYTLTNKYDTAFSWTLKPPPSEISIRSGEAIEIGIGVGPVPASMVRLLQVALIEDTRKNPLAEAGLLLCKNLSGDCDSNIDLAAHSANRLWLRTKDNSYPVGKYTGSVTIAADQKYEGDVITLTVYSSHWCSQVWGLIAIIVGVFGSFFVSTYAKFRLNRDQVLLSAALMREKFKSLQTKLTQALFGIGPTNTKFTSGKLTTFLNDLSNQGLYDKGFLSVTTITTQFLGASSKPDDFKGFLKNKDGWAVALDKIISGMTEAWSQRSTHSAPQQQDTIKNTVGEIDKLAEQEDPPVLKELEDKIKGFLKELDKELNKSIAPTGKAPDDTGDKGIESLIFEINVINWAVVIVTLVLTTLLGSYIVVWSNLGFGLWRDYLFCLLWGFGIPIGGQVLQMTSANVTTALGITVKQP